MTNSELVSYAFIVSTTLCYLLNLFRYYFSRVSRASKLSPSAAKPSSPPSSSLLPPGCDPLPDVFTDMVIGFHGLSVDEERELTRYIVAYNGEAAGNTPTAATTHVLCGRNEITVRLLCPLSFVFCICEYFELPLEGNVYCCLAQPPSLPDGCWAEVVDVEWLRECLRAGRVVSTDKFKVDSSDSPT